MGSIFSVENAKTKLQELHWRSNEIFEAAKEVSDKAIITDIIEIKTDRPEILHYGIFVGEGRIIHLIRGPDGYIQIRKESLIRYARDHLCRIHNFEELIKNGGLKRRTTPEILISAYTRLDDYVKGKVVKKYDVGEKNCEHFVFSIVFGQKFSAQAQIAKKYNLVGIANFGCKFEKACGNICETYVSSPNQNNVQVNIGVTPSKSHIN